MMRHFYLVMSLLLLLFVGCTVAPPTAVPNIPTTIPTPTLAAIEPTESAASAPTAIPDLPPTAVPNPNDLIALALAGLPTNAFDDVNALPLIVTDGERPLWVVHSEGFRNFDLDPFPNHFLAIFTVENGNWLELTRQNLNLESDELFVSPDFLSEGSVNQAIIDPAHIWLTVEGGVGAHGGTFQLLRFDGATLHIEAAASNSNPAVGYLEDLNSDGTPEVVMNMHDFYVFCYACGVRYLYYEVFAWDSVNQRMIEVSIQPMLMGQQGHPAYALNNRAVELANAGLWADALSQIEEAQRQAAATTEPTDTFVLEWNAALIRLYRDAWVAELSYSPYPLLTHIFFGDYAGASNIMRGYTHAQIFSADTPLIKGTMAEGSESWIPDYIFGQVNPA
ncbi:MAG: hypothetical protein GY803_31695, partial [Chloroflexi bacterium]|nr:hypothetical protein [Chloroflexota bacterium]